MGTGLMQRILFMEDFKLIGHVKNFFKCLLFATILIISLLFINRTLEPKYTLINNIWPTTSTYEHFYDMNDNSIDVLFLGSSVVVNAFCPQEIYNEYGIRSYNLGSEQQSIFLSYYWLKEALRFQSPRVVVLDTRFMWPLNVETPLNTKEALIRKSLDPMKWSEVKKEAVHNLCEIDETQSELSYYLTNFRFHSRWTELQEYDFKHYMVSNSELKGFGPITSNGPASFTTYEQKDSSARRKFPLIMQEYLDKTVSLCNENGIKLVLVSLPGNHMNDAVNNTFSEYAHENNIDYINFCSTENYEAIGAILPEESVYYHANIWGAIKLSQYIGMLLRDDYNVSAVEDPQYEQTKQYYERTIKNANLQRISEQMEYLKLIDDSNYIVFITSRADISSIVSDELKEELYNLGLQFSVSERMQDSYCAVIEQGEVVYEEVTSDALNYTGSVRNGNTLYTLQSRGSNTGSSSSIVINNVDYCAAFSVYAKNYAAASKGLNIVVYDMMTSKVIDRVTFYGQQIVR